jgi:hypothetical protein
LLTFPDGPSRSSSTPDKPKSLRCDRAADFIAFAVVGLRIDPSAFHERANVGHAHEEIPADVGGADLLLPDGEANGPLRQAARFDRAPVERGCLDAHNRL